MNKGLSFCILLVCLMLGVAPAWADVVDISGKEKVEVGTWAALKTAVEDSQNAGKVIVLTQDITADKNSPITSVGGDGIIIDGGGHTITGQEGSSDGQFINFDDKDKTDLIIQNVKIEGFGNVQVRSDKLSTGAVIGNKGTIGNISGDFSGNFAQGSYSAAYGGAIYNTGTIGDITGDFSGNFAQSGYYDALGGAIYNYSNAIIGNIVGDFSNNYAQGFSSAYGGAIYNTGTIGNISGAFTGNYAQGSSSAYGGAIYNTGTINDITGNFSGNFAQFGFYDAYGGAIYNSGTIGDITGNFEGNYAQNSSSALGGAIANHSNAIIGNIVGDFTNNFAQSNTSYALGGAIYNAGTMTLTNSSFYDNYVQTGAEKESVEGLKTFGGAIYNIGDLTIRADAGESKFSGNKAIWADGEDSSAIYMAGGQLTLDAVNGGSIVFDDKIASKRPLDLLLKDMINSGYTVSKESNGNYIFEKENDIKVLEYKNNKYTMSIGEETGIEEEKIEEILKEAEARGGTISYDDNNYIVAVDIEGLTIQYEIIQQDDGTYNAYVSYVLSAYGSNMTITGDDSSKVVFNNELNDIGTIDISGTNVEVNEGAGTIYRTVTHDKGVLNINAGAKAEDSIINKDGKMNVADSAEVYRTEVNDGGTLHVASGGYAQDTTVNTGAMLEAEAQAKLHNMLAQGGAVLDIDSGAVLTGNIIIHADAEMGGSYDYSNIFKDEVTDDGSLTLVGGLNDVLTENSLVNNTESKRLHLTAGDYAIGDGAQAVQGWDLLTIKDNANVKLEGDIALTGPTRKVIIENGSTLDLAGHSPSNYTINGSLSNDGAITFTHAGDDADDITTIYGNYTAYNNAQMTIDVNPSNNTSDLLRVEGDVAGTTTVNLKFVNGEAQTSQAIPFVEAPNDDLDTGAYFVINRVYSNAFQWNSLYQDGVWYVGTDNVIPDGSNEGYGVSDTGNMEDDVDLEADAVLPPNFPFVPNNNNNKKPSVVGEAIAYMGLPSAGIEQTRDMMRNISNKVESTKIYSKHCKGFYECMYDAEPLHNAWVSPVYSYSDVKAPYSYEASISGLEAGFDIQRDVYNRLGIFASYRQGNYDFDGDGEDYYSKTGSEIDIDSYILGLYHRYDEGMFWTMSQIFLGYQDVSISSDDGVSSSTEGYEFGGSVGVGLVFNPMTNLTIEPLIRLTYTQIDYDTASDEYGKNAYYDDVQNLEMEAGVKIEKTYKKKDGYAKIYVKPSIIQNIGSGDVRVSSLNKVDGLDNATLGRMEVGGSMNFDEQWSGYANAAYTFGSDYTNLGLNAGLNYAF